MAKVNVALPVPAGAGSGAGVATDTMGAERTITVEGAFEGSINIDTSLDAGTTWSTVISFFQGDSKTVHVAGDMMRVTRVGPVISGAPTVDVAGLDDGGRYGTLNVPAVAGAGASFDATAFGSFTSIAVVGTFGGSITIEVSQDGVDWEPILGFINPGGIKSTSVVARFFRVVRTGLDISGLPVVTLGAINDPQTSSSGGPPGNCLVYQPGGGLSGPAVYADWTELYAALTTLRNNANGGGCYTIVIDDSIVTPAPIPVGAWDMTGVWWSGDWRGETAGVQVVAQVAIGATVPGLMGITENLLVQSLGAPSPRVMVDGDYFVIRHRSRLESAAVAPFLDATALVGGEVATIVMEDNAVLGDDAGDGAAAIGVAGTLVLQLLTASTVRAGALTSSPGSTVSIEVLDSASVVQPQVGILGLIATTDAVIERWNVQAADPGPITAAFGQLIQADPTAAPVVVNLPVITLLNKDQSIIVYNATDVTANAITITPGGGETINGAATYVLNAARAGVLLVADGTSNWIVAARVGEGQAAGSQCLIYQPGGTGAGPVLFSSWTALMAQLTTLRADANNTGCFEIQFDDSIVSPAVVPAGAYDMTGVTLSGGFRTGQAVDGSVAVQFAAGATIPGARLFEGNLLVTAAGAPPRVLLNGDLIVLRETRVAGSAAAVVFFDGSALGAAESASLILETFSTLGNGAAGAVSVSADGILNLQLASQSQVAALALVAPALATINVTYQGSATEIATQAQVNAAAVVNVTTNQIPSWDQTAVQIALFPAEVGDLVRCNPTAGAFAVNLPAITLFNEGKTIVVKNVSASANAITITPAGADTIDGAATLVLAAARASATLISDGASDWMVI